MVSSHYILCSLPPSPDLAGDISICSWRLAGRLPLHPHGRTTWANIADTEHNPTRRAPGTPTRADDAHAIAPHLHGATATTRATLLPNDVPPCAPDAADQVPLHPSVGTYQPPLAPPSTPRQRPSTRPTRPTSLPSTPHVGLPPPPRHVIFGEGPQRCAPPSSPWHCQAPN
jgi:hypothetical protein